MPNTKSIILAREVDNILSILKNIIENEGDSPLIDYPVLIGSRAAKWHALYFREPNDWDLVATLSQSTSFIDKLRFNASFKYIILIYFPGAGLKIVGDCIEMHTDNSISFDIELVSNKIDLRKMKSNEAVIDDKVNNVENFKNKKLKIKKTHKADLSIETKDISVE